ncbi:hypothetical protein R5R35_006316 [Gryllus longicercus]|uniref:Metalloendopeptidase n=1 Tax=Gryllus longicercus TaxID=2509291 RepID=A0AAN9Z526_9ORTH
MLDLAEENEYPDLGDKYQGDIIRPSDLQRGDSRNAVKIESHLWPGGVIPYVLHSNYTGDRKKMMMAAMRGLEKETCIKFVPWSGQQDYVLMRTVPGDGCYAMVGRYKDLGQPHPLNLESGCFRGPGAIQHELLHVIGLYHEQSRPDRDDYVNVLWNNIPKKFWPDFSKANPSEVSTYGVAYGYDSIMHYPKTAFSKNGKPTIVAKKDPSKELGQRKKPTKGDILKVRKMYKC